MQNAAVTPKSWVGPALIGVGLITLARIVLLAFNKTDLFVDEAQYWLWGQDLAFGYYSKPPLIGWVIRAFTEIGTNAPFWVRLPGPLFHGATALILGAIAAQLFDRRAAIMVALAYVTLPVVAVGSLLISTDTIMFPFLAAALLGYFRLQERASPSTAIITGAMLGLAFMAKYAAIYYILCAGLAMVLPSARLNWRSIALILGAFLVVISPNLIWNILNGLTTVQHTLDNADWVRDPSKRAGFNIAGLSEFFFAQFAVFGPILFGALLLLAVKAKTQTVKTLILFAIPIILIVCVQAFLSRAYANWAAAAYLAATLAVVPWLMGQHRAWLIASFAINGALCLLFPLATTAPTLLARDGQPLLNRYIGRTDMSQSILDIAADANLTTIVASDRDILADLFYTARDQSIDIFALPPHGRAPHHYALRFPYQPHETQILFVMTADQIPPCSAAFHLTDIRPATGGYLRHPQSLYRMPGTCLSPKS